MIAHDFLPDSFGRDFCTKKLDERGRIVTCCAPLKDHAADPVGLDLIVPRLPRLPDVWLVDSVGASVRFCRPHETVSFTAQTARALAAALLVAAEEAEEVADG